MKYQLVILLLFPTNLFAQNYIAQWTSSIHDIYEVQQSVDGEAWETIGTVPGLIEKSTYHYVVPGAGYFYRIKAGDVNSISIWLQPVIMPVNITSASVKASTLTWNVSNEDGIDYYLIESSTDGIDFKEISKVKATGSNIYKMSLK
jgi:hypothetical protein